MSQFKFTQPHRKRRVSCSKECPVPVPVEGWSALPAAADRWCYYTGVIVGDSVVIKHTGDMDFLYKMGYFGKGTLSRSKPEYSRGYRGVHRRRGTRPSDRGQGEGQMLRLISRRRYLRHVSWNTEGQPAECCEGTSRDPTNTSFRAENDEGTLPLPLPTKKQPESRYIFHDLKDRPVSEAKMYEDARGDGNVEMETAPGRGSDVVVDEVQGERPTEMELVSPAAHRQEQQASIHREQVDLCWSATTQETSQDFWASTTGQSPKVSTEHTLKWDSTTQKESEDFWSLDQTKKQGREGDQDTLVLPKVVPADQRAKPLRYTASSEQGSVVVSERLGVTNSSVADCSVAVAGNVSSDFTSSSKVTQGHQRSENSSATFRRETMADVTETSSEHGQMCESGEGDGKRTSDEESGGRFDPRSVCDDVDGTLFVVEDTEESDVDEGAALEVLQKWRPTIKQAPFELVEELKLSLEEAFFLAYGLGCLVILDQSGRPLGLTELWQRFLQMHSSFLPKYIVYHNLRSKGWVPKSGLKYGANYIIYKEGPPFYHSTYSVIIKTVKQDDLQSDPDFPDRRLSWTSLARLNRTAEQTKKEIMLCYVLRPAHLTASSLQSPKCISLFTVQEVIVRRWVSKHERDNAEYILIP